MKLAFYVEKVGAQRASWRAADRYSFWRKSKFHAFHRVSCFLFVNIGIKIIQSMSSDDDENKRASNEILNISFSMCYAFRQSCFCDISKSSTAFSIIPDNCWYQNREGFAKENSQLHLPTALYSFPRSLNHVPAFQLQLSRRFRDKILLD
jgi:hypothetical protein